MMTTIHSKYTTTLRLLIITLMILFVKVAYSQEIGFPLIRNYITKEYNNYPQVWCAIQSNTGMMYFGAAGGIMEYDGVSWRNIPNEKQATTRDLAIDKKGKIYVGSEGEFGYLTADKKGNTIYQTLTHLLTDSTIKLGTIWSVKLTSKFVYFQTYDAIFQYSSTPENLQIFKADTNYSFFGTFVYDDIYYVRLPKKGVMKIENSELKSIPQSDFFKIKNSFSVALRYNSTALLVPTRTNGIYLYQPNKDTVPQIFKTSDEDFFKDNNLYNASVFLKEYFVLGSLKKGVLLIDKQGTALQHYNESNLLQADQIYGITNDTSQNLWFGLSNGISKTEHGQDLSYWNKNSGLKGSVICVIRHDSTIYIATMIKVYFIDKKNQIQEIQNISTGQNWCFLETKKSLLVGTATGIYEIKGDKAEQIYKGSHAFELYQSTKNPYRVLSTDYDCLISFKYENGKWVFEGNWEGIKENIRGIIEDEKGEIWLASYRNGAIRVTPDYENITKPKKVRYYNKKDGLISLKDILPFKFKNKILWGTEKGIYSYNSKDDNFKPFCELDEQFCNGSRDVYRLKEMPDGKIWICPAQNRNADIGYLQPNNTGGYDWIYKPFRRIPDMTLGAFYIDPSGVAWIGGNEGLYRYDMTKDTKNYAQTFNCLIRKITYGPDSTLLVGDTPEINQSVLAYKYNSLKFEFAAPFFDQEEKTSYSYQLVGFDAEWSKWSRKTEKEYTNLSEGTYNFQVKARNVYDVESKTSIYQITILPPFYRRWWAFSIYLILSGLLIYIFIYWRIAALKRQKKHLERIVKEKTAEVVQQKDEISAKNDKLLEMDEFKQGMTSMIVHDLKNPLNTILNIPRSFTPEKQITAMQQSGKQMLNMVLNILDVHKYEESAMKLELSEKQIVLIVSNAINQVQFLSDQKDIILKNQTEQGLYVKVEEEIAERIIVNLLTNAIKYTPIGGTISISTIQLPMEMVRVEVSDTGEGIAEDKLDLVFKKFGQVVVKKSGGVRSTGLGLTFCKMAVEAHGGEIGLNSEVGKGTTFWFTLQSGKTEQFTFPIVTEEREIEKERLIFTEEDKLVLNPIIDRLKIFTIYETDDIEEIITELKQNKAENIQKWILEIEKNMASLNQNSYLELLKIY